MKILNLNAFKLKILILKTVQKFSKTKFVFKNERSHKLLNTIVILRKLFGNRITQKSEVSKPTEM